jgi:hypothetical protein
VLLIEEGRIDADAFITTQEKLLEMHGSESNVGAVLREHLRRLLRGKEESEGLKR